MQADQLYALLQNLGLRKVQPPNNGNIMACCPFHNENNPSFGVRISDLRTNCFVCGGMSFARVVAHCNKFYVVNKKGEYVYDYARAYEWLRERFNITFKEVPKDTRQVSRYDDLFDTDEGESNSFYYEEYRLSKFHSGKFTHQMFFDFGFTKEIGKIYGIGFDDSLRRITIPVRWKDGTLAGLIGRATEDVPYLRVTKTFTYFSKSGKFVRLKYDKIVRNQRYYLYWNFNKSKVLYPLWKCDMELSRKVTRKLSDRLRKSKFLIICEGALDALWLHQLGLTNALAVLGSKVSKEQLDLINSYEPDFVVEMLDADDAGRNGADAFYKQAKKRYPIYRVNYPVGKKDPRECNKAEIFNMLNSSCFYTKKHIDKVA